jgi:anti-anti-sigma factor
MSGTISHLYPETEPSRTITLCAKGDLDINDVQVLASELVLAIADAQKTGSANIIIDCAALTFIDAATIHAIVAAQNAAADQHVSLRLRNVNGTPARVLYVLGLWQRLCLEPRL